MQSFEIEMHCSARGETWFQVKEASDPTAALQKYLRQKFVAERLLSEETFSIIVRDVGDG